MSFITRIILGLGAAAIGAFFVIRTEWLVETLGYSAWAEAKLGGGGTRLMYKMIGLAIIFIGFLGATGLLGGFLIGTIGRLFAPGGTQ